MRGRLALLFALALAALGLSQGQLTPAVAQDAGIRREFHRLTGKLIFLGADKSAPILVPRAQAPGLAQEVRNRAMLAPYAAEFGLRNAAEQLSVLSQKQARGLQVTRFQQVQNGVPVMAGELVVVAAADGLVSIDGEIAPDLDLDVTPAIPAEEARQTALLAIAKSMDVAAENLQASEPALWVYDARLLQPDGLPPALVWRMDVTSLDAAAPVRELVLVDAQRGNIRLHFNQLDGGWSQRGRGQAPPPTPTELPTEASTQPPSSGAQGLIPSDASPTAVMQLGSNLALAPLSVSTYDMNHSSNEALLPGTFVCDQDSHAACGTVPDATQAQIYAEGVHQFYLDKHGRDSLDNAGLPIISSVRFGTNYQNAFWNGSQMVYGDGMAADDVVGHELTHGVTQYESNLFYWYQSGAINESLSDVWGELYDQANGLGNDAPSVRWHLAEDSALGTIRDMSNPPAYSDPDKMTSSYYYTGGGDNGGVHYNSGLNNKAAYLMVDGGTFNGRTVAALGADKTLAIYYEAQTNLLTSGADYLDLYDVLYQACLNIVGGPEGVSSGDCQEVRDATDAVEMNLQPVAGFNTDAPFCTSGDISGMTFFDDLESGSADWTFAVPTGSGTRWQYDMPPAYGSNAHSGLHYLYADDYPGATTDATATLGAVLIPANAYLHFAQTYLFEYSLTPKRYYDGGVLEYSTNGGSTWTDAGSLMEVNGYDQTIYSTNSTNPLAGRLAFAGDSHGYISTRLNLSALAGQNVTFRWRMGLDQSVARGGWWLDDVRIYQCSQPTNTPTSTPTNTAAPTNTPTNTATFTATSTSSPTWTPTNTSTATNTATSTATSTATNTPTNTATSTPTNTPTYTPTFTATNTTAPSSTPTNTLTPTNTATNTPTSTATLTPTNTTVPSSTPTNTATNTPTNTATPTATNTTAPSSTSTNTPTDTPTHTPTNTTVPSNTPTNTPTNTATPTSTNTAVASSTPTETPTHTATNTTAPSATPTSTATDTPTLTATSTTAPSSTPTNTPTFTATSTTVPSETPTGTPTYTPTFTATYTVVASNTPTTTPTDTPTPTATSTTVPSSTPTDTPTETPTLTATSTTVPSSTPTDTPSSTATRTATSTATSTLTSTATPHPPIVSAVYPANGEQACRRPQVGVRLILSDLVRTGSGSFNPSTVVLKVDGNPVTNLATISEAAIHPSEIAVILYLPPVDMTLGLHQAAFTYPLPTGTDTVTWNFTVGDIGCVSTIPTATGNAHIPLSQQQLAQTATSASLGVSPLSQGASEGAGVSPSPTATGTTQPGPRLFRRQLVLPP